MQNAPLEHSTILLACIKRSSVLKPNFWSYFEWPLKTVFTVQDWLEENHIITTSQLIVCYSSSCYISETRTAPVKLLDSIVLISKFVLYSQDGERFTTVKVLSGKKLQFRIYSRYYVVFFFFLGLLMVHQGNNSEEKRPLVYSFYPFKPSALLWD